MDPKHVVVLGAGISGLWAVHTLLRLNPDLEVTVLEKQAAPGGLFDSSDRCGFHFNHGLFLFPADSPLIALQPHRFSPITVSYDKVINGRMIRFPVDPLEMQAICRPARIPGFLIHMARRQVKRSGNGIPGDLNEWLRLHLPDTWSRIFRIDDYVYKLMGHEPEQLSHEVGKQRLEYIVRMLRPENLSRHMMRKIRRSLGSKPAGPPPASVVSHYTLDREGTGGFVRELADRVTAKGTRILNRVSVRRITGTDPGFRIDIDNNDPIHCDLVVSTIPLTELAAYRTDAAPPMETLKWRNIGLFFFRLRRTLPDQPIRVIYSFDRNQVWKRVVMRRIDDTSAAVRAEMCSHDPLKPRHGELMKTIRTDLSELFQVTRDTDWMDWDALDVPYGYPCLLKGYEQQVDRVMATILEPGICTLSRQGVHRYSTSSICARLVEKGVSDFASRYGLYRSV
ncbi:MAG TPA: FAD-dependent oxidoreductase [bacterium]|nr:FAD-dependent oxidoreductase [bacterium]